MIKLLQISIGVHLFFNTIDSQKHLPLSSCTDFLIEGPLTITRNSYQGQSTIQPYQQIEFDMHVNDICTNNPNVYCNIFYFTFNNKIQHYWPALFVGSNYGSGNNQKLRLHSGTNSKSDARTDSDPDITLEKNSTYHIFISIAPKNIYIEVNGAGSIYTKDLDGNVGFDRSNYYGQAVDFYISTGAADWQSYPAELSNLCIRSSSNELIQMQSSVSSKYLWFEAGVKSWWDAKLYCEEVGSSLASIHSNSENVEVTDLCSSVGLHCFIGLNDVTTEGEYVWTDGTNYDYNNWNPGQPDGQSQDCAVLVTGDTLPEGGWHDTWCNQEYYHPFVCSAPTLNPTLNPTQAPTVQNLYHYVYGKLCANLAEHYKVEYDGDLNQCVEQCINIGDKCTVFNYFKNFKSNDDSRCYIFDEICEIEEDKNGNLTNRSIIGYETFDVECVDYPYDWRDNIGDSCTQYLKNSWCSNGDTLKHDQNFYGLTDSKYGLSAIEACCDCGGSIYNMDNVAMSYDYDWNVFQDDILCHFTSPYPYTYFKSPYRAWNNLVLYDLCKTLTIISYCDALIDSQFESNPDETYSIYICDNYQLNDSINAYEFIMEFVSNVADQSHVIYVNSLWFNIDIAYYSESVIIGNMNITECNHDILTINDVNSNTSNYIRQGIHPCYTLDVYSTTESVDVQPQTNSDNDVIVIIVCGIVLIIVIILLIVLYLRKKQKESKRLRQKHKEMEMQSYKFENNDRVIAPSAPVLDDGTNEHAGNEENQCIICCENKANMFNYPCGHVTYCNDCSIDALQQSNRCPNCRVQIQCKQIYNAGFSS